MKDLELLNADGLDESILNTNGVYSSADGEDDKEYEDEENTDSEPSDEEGVSEEELPKYRALVKNKKLELKAQYGKAKISIGECGIKPLNPDIKYPNVICLWDCSKSKNYNKDCCATNRNQAVKRAEQRKNIESWEKCRATNKGIIKWGWRKKWREFKKSGGLAQLKLQAKGLAPIPKPITAPVNTTVAPNVVTASTQPKATVTSVSIPKSVKSLEGLTPKKSDKSDVKEKDSETIDKSTVEKTIEKEIKTINDKFLGMPKAIGITVAVVGGLALVVGGIFLVKKLRK
jgi:hypothetical protein